jgi:deoxyadenosine/deoxycytidine kinase
MAYATNVVLPPSGKPWQLARAQRPLNLSVEGLIGAGKSTLIRRIQQENLLGDVFVHGEDLDLWRAIPTPVGPANILDSFYKDPRENSYLFQNTVTQTMALRYSNCAEPNRVRLHDRSLESCFHVFATLLFQDGLMSSSELGSLRIWYDHIHTHFPAKLYSIIYVDTPPQVAFERIQRRNRAEEADLSLEYLVKLQQAHESWLEKVKDDGSSIVLRLNGDCPPEGIVSQFVEALPSLGLKHLGLA